MTTTSLNQTWVLDKAVLVYALDFDVSCFARIRVAFDANTNQGSISLNVKADLANLSGKSQELKLNVPPEVVETCKLSRKSNDGLCPSGLVSMLPTPVTHVSAASTLELTLNETGIVLRPARMKFLSPAKPGDLNFYAFARVCQSKLLRLHFARRQFAVKELNQLETFSVALQKRSVQAETFDYDRHGLAQTDWHAFKLSHEPPPDYDDEQVDQVDPPPYPVSRNGKRLRSMSSGEERRTRPLLSSPLSLDSPTEVDPSSPCSTSPASICPTDFKHASSPGLTKLSRLDHLENELRDVSDDQLCKLLIRLGKQHLLANVVSFLPSESGNESEQIRFATFKSFERRLEQYVNGEIDRRFKQFVNKAVSECCDQVLDQALDQHKTNAADLDDQVEDGKTDLCNATNDFMKDLEEEAQKHKDEIDEQGQQCLDVIENRAFEVEMSTQKAITKLERWFNASAQSLLDRKSSTSQESDVIVVRRSSI
ncbi:uncharacterized protein N7511_011278 [Penicillium nucicola]|uniref:uncharacterized protein n=1 Tax=Penicillium nucicola TaxID=1850975 RepID=UPI0025456299|nr:uncharacterized protein N7511_011278 [Penicillium nucicola]KAJ5742546.1 hypothetical protein N7511_011278 [Penicillium nucicola]